MADLSDAYGQNFQNESQQSRTEYILTNIATNLAHRQFKFRLHDSNDLWDQSGNIKANYISTLIQKIANINKKFNVTHLNKNSQQINMLPELIIDTPVEYLLIVDADFGRAYFIYITPQEVNSY